jgi:hypothetical protein
VTRPVTPISDDGRPMYCDLLDERVLFVAHGQVIRCLRYLLEAWSLEEMERQGGMKGLPTAARNDPMWIQVPRAVPLVSRATSGQNDASQSLSGRQAAHPIVGSKPGQVSIGRDRRAA